MKKMLSLMIAFMTLISVLFSQTALMVKAEEIIDIDRTEETVNELSSYDPEKLAECFTEEDIAYVRSEMVKHTREFTLSVPYSEELYNNDCGKYVMDEAMKHTGEPKEGDNLRRQIGLSGYAIFTKDSITTLEFTFNYYTDADQETMADQAVDKVLKELDVYNAPDYVKILKVYRWMADNIEYDHKEYGPDNKLKYSAYGAIVERKAVCQGYANLFYRLMLELGVDCRFVDGIGNGDFHAWNIVKLHGKYYGIDVTWASTSGLYDEFFLKGSSSEFFHDHIAMPEFQTEEFVSEYPLASEDYKPNNSDIRDGFLFSDVSNPLSYYFSAVYWAYDHKPQITTGTSETEFSPNASLTRGQIVTFLWRMMGEPKAEHDMPFTDVKEGKFYYDAVAWAASTGITTGTGPTTFSPGDKVTRAQIVTFLWRAKGKPEPKTAADFKDVPSDKYFHKAVSWAYENGITTGTSETAFSPNSTCTRGQAATFLYRADQPGE